MAQDPGCENQSALERSGTFATTHWSVVLAAGAGDSSQSDAALERLCRTYWYPIYAHVRRRGYREHDAEDLTQGFIAHLLERRPFRRISPDRGKFRSFLLASLNHFLADDHDRQRALKRGGGWTAIPLDAHQAEERLQYEQNHALSPEREFERRWVATLVDEILVRLKEEFARKGRAEQFGRLSEFLVEGAGRGTYAEAALDLKMTEEAVGKAVQRMRRRYYELFREEVIRTVASPEDVDEELRHLCSVLGT